LAKKLDTSFVTVGPCNILGVLERFVHVELAGAHLNWMEYKQIEAFYGDRQAERSGLFLMNHIDEGVKILRELPYSHRWSAVEQGAFMLHPLLQADADFAENLTKLWIETSPQGWPKEQRGHLGGEELLLAVEYRNIANQFLSPMEDHPGYEDHTKIVLSPIAAVNRMLIADKVQNYKDFLAHHEDHPRAEWLERYFQQWFKRLGVTMDEYQRLVATIEVPQVRLLPWEVA
jgi:hypothetical protein